MGEELAAESDGEGEEEYPFKDPRMLLKGRHDPQAEALKKKISTLQVVFSLLFSPLSLFLLVLLRWRADQPCDVRAQFLQIDTIRVERERRPKRGGARSTASSEVVSFSFISLPLLCCCHACVSLSFFSLPLSFSSPICLPAFFSMSPPRLLSPSPA